MSPLSLACGLLVCVHTAPGRLAAVAGSAPATARYLELPGYRTFWRRCRQPPPETLSALTRHSLARNPLPAGHFYPGG